MFFTYVLESIKDGDKYSGFTKNLELKSVELVLGMDNSVKNFL